jgi:methionyl-tRNA formyltransferase
MTSDLREKPLVVLIGYGPTALGALRSLIRLCRVGAVVRNTSDSNCDPVQSLAEGEGIPVCPLTQPAEIAKLIGNIQPDAVVISSYNRIIPPAVLKLSRFINVHYAPLPRYRGRANVNWALINGEPSAAISIHMVAPGLDSGNLLYQEEISIGPTDTAATLYERLNAIQERQLGDAVLRLLLGDEGRPQDDAQATYGCTRVPADGEIDWRASTVAIDRLIRALAPPLPGAFTFCETERFTISRAVPVWDAPVFEGRVPGRVVGRSKAEGWVDVLTGDGVLRLLELVDSSGNALRPALCLKSTLATLGLSKADLLDRIRALEARLTALEGCLPSYAATGACDPNYGPPLRPTASHHLNK